MGNSHCLSVSQGGRNIAVTENDLPCCQGWFYGFRTMESAIGSEEELERGRGEGEMIANVSSNFSANRPIRWLCSEKDIVSGASKTLSESGTVACGPATIRSLEDDEESLFFHTAMPSPYPSTGSGQALPMGEGNML